MRKKILIIGLVIIILPICLLVGINEYVKNFSDEYIVSAEFAEKLQNTDCVIVLGCQVMPNGNPSGMLKDRLLCGIDLYNRGAAPKIIMSGDHGQKEYDEVNAMKQFAVDKNIPSEDIFMDHAGFSTYESIYRAKEVFKASSVIIVSQEYHLHRAVYIARNLGIEAYGVSSDYNEYSGQQYREGREILARCKDVFKVFFKFKPTYLGEAIPVSGDGDLTND